MNTKKIGKYKITSKIRFTIFTVVVLLILTTMLSTFFGFNTAGSASLNQYNQVAVKTGDTIWNIANQFKPANKDIREVVYDICELNDLEADSLTAGQDIIVPVYNQ